MKFSAIMALGLTTVSLACGGGSSHKNSMLPIAASSSNVQPIVVNSGPAGNYANGLFTSVTLCVPATAGCRRSTRRPYKAEAPGGRPVLSFLGPQPRRLRLFLGRLARRRPVGNVAGALAALARAVATIRGRGRIGQRGGDGG